MNISPLLHLSFINRGSFWTVALIIFLISISGPLKVNGQSRFLHMDEIQVIDQAGGGVTVTLTDIDADTSSVVSVGAYGNVGLSFIENMGDITGYPHILYELRIVAPSVSASYTYMYCNPPTVDLEEVGFYCPNNATDPGQADFYIYVQNSHIKIKPGDLNPGSGNSDDVTTYFSDPNWMLPYNLDTFCAGSSSGCDIEEIKWFLTPQLSIGNFTFTDSNLEQPTNAEWYFKDVDLVFPSSKTLTINNSIEFGEDSFSFQDGSAMIFNGTDDDFVVAAGASFLLGDDVRLTFESEITLTGTALKPITFSPLAGGDRWDYLDLKADGNDFDYVIFDGGYKTVEIRSDDNTFDNVTFKNGWRGVSSNSSTLGGRSSFSLNHSFVQNNTTVGVVAVNSDFSMNNTEVSGNGEAGVYLVNAISDNFTDNLVENNATTSTTRSGIEVSAGGDLDAWDNATNTIKNNIFHEVSTTSSGLANLGTVVSSNPGGRNSIYDIGTQATGEKYISDGGTYDVSAEDNCWNTTSAPSSSFFSGTVDRDPFYSCGPYYSKQGLATTSTKSLKQLIQEARQIILESAPNYRAKDLAHLFVVQRLDKEDKLNEKALTNSLIRTVASTNGAFLGKEAISARERALLMEIQESVFLENYRLGLQQVKDAEPFINNPLNQIDLLFSKVSILESFRSYSSALKVLQQIERNPAFSKELVPTIEIMTQAISERLLDPDAISDAFIVDPWGYGISKGNSLNGSEGNNKQTAQISAYPNPFNPTTTLQFTVPEKATVNVSVFNSLGQLVETLVNASLSAGLHQVRFNATGQSSGLYFVRSQIGSQTITTQLVLLK